MAARLTPQQKQLRLIPESKFQTDVNRILTEYGWRWFHAPANIPRNGWIQNVRAGFPDICAVRGTRLVFIELKTETGKTSEEQDRWLAAVAEAGAEAYVFRPSDLGRIHQIMGRPGLF